jgi:HEPN domain-containing protein
MKFITSQWLESAKSDLSTIEAILSNDLLTHVVAFHAQQCVEKALTAVIEEYELSSKKIHDLVTLKNMIATVYEFDFDEDMLGLLNKLYLDSRYPGDLGLFPDGKPTTEDARGFFNFAQGVYKDVKNFLNESPAS